MDGMIFLQDAPGGTSGTPGTPAPAGTSQPAPGTGDAPAAPQASTNTFSMVIPLVLMFVVFYFLLIRPQRRQQKERENMLGNIKKNDHVVTTGGIFGVVDSVKDDRVILKIDEKNDIRVRVARSAIAGVEKVSGAEGEAKDEDKK